MSSVQERDRSAAQTSASATVDMKLEVIVIPVSDVDRAKPFYGSLGWPLDAGVADDAEYVVREQAGEELPS